MHPPTSSPPATPAISPDIFSLSDLASRAPSVQQAYAHVRDGIMSGKFPEGARVTEKEVSEALGLSRTPVREGLRLLVADGFLVLRPNAGATVRAWSDQEIRDLYAARILIESELAALAATRMSADTLAELREIEDEMESRGPDTSAANLDRISALNRTFHARIYDSAGNARLRTMRAKAVDIKIILRTRRSYDRDRLARTFQHHRELIDAFTARDPEWARAAMHCHLRSAQFALLERQEHGG
ncbi:HTH-type transcriptional repressor CsiR [Pigmentiphaga humi]|uniref:HTH-type transcriptional repressor CsiR n=1 Tax=Pigmentiphaga humi TaxID=2478468 RepID=A0A3P4B1V5_9BURK|nr:GntR family transcriptional regulator [Pigmentiphaga humi]VCU69861.1 HTH-type transcriptional repressor CsiR [Pigmentiphaga humi]